LVVHAAAAAGLVEMEWRGLGRSSTGGDWRLAAPQLLARQRWSGGVGEEQHGRGLEAGG
jgi:hypothetical protein